MEFDALSDVTQGDYDAFVAWLCQSTVEQLEESDDIEAAAKAIRWYIQEAYHAHLSSGEVVDFFCVSRDSVIERTTRWECRDDELVNLFDRLHEEHWAAKGSGCP